MLRKPILFFLMIAVYALIASCGCAGKAGTAKPVGSVLKDIDASKAAEMIESEKNNPGFVIIDVRTPGEFSSGHIAGAVNIDISSPGFSGEIDKLARDKKYLIYCRTGSRSRRAMAIMEALNFKEVYNLFGGIVEWEAEGFPAVR